MAFLQEPEPPRGVPEQVLPGIRRIVARNPGVMTYHGTNTYLVETSGGLVILDPGPNDAQHVREILAAAGSAPICHILLTHTHGDHFGATAALRAATNAPIYAYKISARAGFTPDIPLDDGDSLAGFTSVFTPGHAADHLCFEFFAAGTKKILFSGDHVMSWSSSIVNPPAGNMQDYYRSLERLLGRDDTLYLGGHGPVLANPQTLTAALLAHRQQREAGILAELRVQSWSVAALAAKLYHKLDPFLKIAAQRNVLAHLLKLDAEGVVRELPAGTVQHADNMELSARAKVNGESSGELAALNADARRRFELNPS